jgi:hypothetical protein
MSFREVRLKVLRHELGHWLVARHLGFKTGNIEITVHQNDGPRGSKVYVQEGTSMVFPDPVIKNTDELKTYLEQRFQILYAGTYAQVHGQNLTEEEIDQVMEVDAGSDLRVIRELAPILRGMQFGAEQGAEEFERQFQEITGPIKQKTQMLIAQLFPMIDWIATHLAPHVMKHGARYPFTPIHITDFEKLFPNDKP